MSSSFGLKGMILGPLSAARSYARTHTLFTELDVPRCAAQIELALVVVNEVFGQLALSARQYEQLTTDERLSLRDRACARLWIGTALGKEGDNAHAGRVMAAAIREFGELGEPEDWSVAHQKLALAHRGSGDLSGADGHAVRPDPSAAQHREHPTALQGSAGPPYRLSGQ
ncbi:hypothetical protein [Streptomyces yaizuensis]|uniref:Uncharacterized protein n=1 Tax=Streptomyces yaizuensis TaxID=2989713 RepID=A0ABQ5PA31_9ACTN|nr:hypothetical protein [Streptomyces sp. YSPA8]GLF99445.1 hypothetical protein SYYSPA8_34130 [Streptomyces sp. YSPA8]